MSPRWHSTMAATHCNDAMLQIRSAAMGWVKEPGAERQTPVFLRNKTAQVVSKLVQVCCTGILLSMSLAWHCQPVREASVAGHVISPASLTEHAQATAVTAASPATALHSNNSSSAH